MTRPVSSTGFAEQLEKNEAVKVYAKLPGWFKVLTPLGTYNPGWAGLVDKNREERLYFVLETKSTLFTDDPAPRSSGAKPTSRPSPSATSPHALLSPVTSTTC